MRSKNTYFAAVALLLVAGFLATSLTSYFVAHNALSKQIAGEMLPLTSDNIYSEIQRDLLTPILISSLMANDTFVRDWAAAGERDEAPIRSYLAEIQRKYGTITAFFISDRTRNYYHPSGILKQVSEADPADAWYFRVRASSAPYEVNVDADTADRSRVNIFINYRVVTRDGGYLGVAGVGLSVNSVTGLIENYQRRYGRNIYFVDRNGAVTLHGSGFTLEPNLRQRPGLAHYATQILTNPSTSIDYTDAEDRRIYLNSRLVPEFGWYLLVEQRDGPAERSIQASLVFNILLSLAITLLVMVIAHYTLRRYQGRLEQMATTDKLTGTASRQVFDLVFEHVVKSARRRNRPLAMLNIDIDHFKAINDTFGHEGGDEVIREVADRIRRTIREADTLCRWGGEEFLVLLDDCALVGACERAEMIRQAVKARPIRFGRDQIEVTISIGAAAYVEGEELAALVRRSDEALYAAKNQGRDRVATL